jgi:hypothetical protein
VAGLSLPYTNSEGGSGVLARDPEVGTLSVVWDSAAAVRTRAGARSVVMLLALGLFGGAGAARAQDAGSGVAPAKPPKKPPPVSMVVEVGHENYTRNGARVPVRVVLDNNGDPVKGILELKHFADGKTRVTDTPVELPRKAHKEYVLFAPLSTEPYNYQATSGELSLRDGMRVVARQALTPKYEDAVLVTTCTGDGSGLQFLNEAKRYREPGEGRPYHSWHRSTQDMPRVWAGFEPADVVVVTGRAWGSMDDDQRRALRMWVEHGGRAILTAESTMEWRDPEGLALAGVTPRDLNALTGLTCVRRWGEEDYQATAGTILTVAGPLRPGSEVTCDEGGKPLIVTRRALAGRVVWMGFNPFQPNFRLWPPYKTFWRRALNWARKGGEPELLTEMIGVNEARAAATSLPRLPAPPLPAIILFGILYAVVFGPVNIFILQRLRRTVRSWLVMPALAMTMTLVVLFLGQLWGRTRTVLNSYSVLVAASGGRTAMEENLTGIFCPTNQNFDLTVEDPAPEVADQSGEDQPLDLTWPDHQQEGTVRWSGTAFQLFSTRTLQLRHPVDLNGSIEIALAEGSRPRGTVVNGTGLKLRNAYVRNAGQFLALGEVAPGETKTLRSAGWKAKLPEPDRATPAGELLENRTFRENAEYLWKNAIGSLVMSRARRDAWLVAEAPEFRGGVGVSEAPYTNRSTLLLVRVPMGSEEARLALGETP